MRMRILKDAALFLIAGGVLLQATSCTDVGIGITALSSAISAGGVLYIVRRIISN